MNEIWQWIRRLWALEGFRPDIALARDEASHFLPWIIALMVYLAALTLTGGFTLHRTVMAGHEARAQSFSVHLPHMNDKAQETTDKVLAVVKETPGVAEAAVLDSGRIREMVEPWLGKSNSLSSLPLPTVIEGKLAKDTMVDFAALKIKIDAIAPGADVDDHKQWFEQFSGFVHIVQWVFYAIAVFIIATTAAVVIFACKTSLKIHRNTVNLLHRLGAMDGYIASQFQQHATLLALKGAFVGSGFAASTLLALYLMARHIDSPLFPSFALSSLHAAILVALPVLMSLIALASARISVLSTLRKMP